MKFDTLPAVGQPIEGGLFAGVTTKPDGTHCAVVLLADKPAKDLTWKAAMNWAEKLGAELPARPVSALLFANLKAEFDPSWHWTCEQFDSSYAWRQFFGNGNQLISDKSFQARARAVRLIQLTA
jgi:hypothetical protein